MKKLIITISALSLFIWALPAFSMEGHSGHEASTPDAHGQNKGVFTHEAVVDGIRTEFQIMSLESMNMKDPGGATHHVMLRLFNAKENHQIKEIAGKVKVISPTKEEQTAALKDYSGIYAANFAFTEKGKYGVICLFKSADKKHVVKFWYHHM